MSETGQPVTILSAGEGWNLLASAALGRLVTSVDGQAEIFPVNFVVQRRTVLFRTSDGYYCPSHAPQARARFRKPYETRATLSGRRPPVRL